MGNWKSSAAAQEEAVSSSGNPVSPPPLSRAGNTKDPKESAPRRFVESVAVRDGTGAANVNVNALALQLGGTSNL
jgi:hypothetical protein